MCTGEAAVGISVGWLYSTVYPDIIAVPQHIVARSALVYCFSRATKLHKLTQQYNIHGSHL